MNGRYRLSKGTSVVYQANETREPIFTLALDSATDSQQFTIQEADFRPGDTLGVTADVAAGKLEFDISLSAGGEYDFSFKRNSEVGSKPSCTKRSIFQPTLLTISISAIGNEPWVPVGVTGVIRGAIRNANVVALQDLSLLAIPKDVFLKHWHHTYNQQEFAQLFRSSD